jgi:hypothetical protein
MCRHHLPPKRTMPDGGHGKAELGLQERCGAGRWSPDSITLVVMLLLSQGKRSTGRQLGNPVLLSEAYVTPSRDK